MYFHSEHIVWHTQANTQSITNTQNHLPLPAPYPLPVTSTLPR